MKWRPLRVEVWGLSLLCSAWREVAILTNALVRHAQHGPKIRFGKLRKGLKTRNHSIEPIRFFNNRAAERILLICKQLRTLRIATLRPIAQATEQLRRSRNRRDRIPHIMGNLAGQTRDGAHLAHLHFLAEFVQVIMRRPALALSPPHLQRPQEEEIANSETRQRRYKPRKRQEQLGDNTYRRRYRDCGNRRPQSGPFPCKSLHLALSRHVGPIPFCASVRILGHSQKARSGIESA